MSSASHAPVQQRQRKKILAIQYTIAWFCVTEEEAGLARASLDQLHYAPDFSSSGDGYYTYGEISGEHGTHNIVIIKSAGSGKVAMGIASAKGLLRSSFPNLRLAFVVGIAAGLPTGDKDIFKGDVVVATPLDGHDAVIEYDYAEVHGDHKFRPKQHADKTALALRNCFGSWYGDYSHGDIEAVNKILKSLVERRQSFSAPDFDEDVLFRPENEHLDAAVRDCTSCRNLYQDRRPRSTQKEGRCYPLTVHRGQVLTGSSLIKSADARERILQSFPEALCVDMESAVLMDTWHPLVVRGISDYGDSHYDWKWTYYASATASAVAKSVIRTLRPDFVASQAAFQPAVETEMTPPVEESALPEAFSDPTSPDDGKPRRDTFSTVSTTSTESGGRKHSSATSVSTTAPPETETERKTQALLTPASVTPTRNVSTTLASSTQLITLSEFAERTDSAIALIENGADVTATDEHGNTALHYAVEHPDTALTKKLLAKDPLIAVLPNHQGRNPLHLCVVNLTQRSLEHAKLLLQAGRGRSWFLPDARDGVRNRGKTALEYTIAKYPSNHSERMLKHLLKAGATWPDSDRPIYPDYVEIKAEYERCYNGRRS